MIRIFFYYCIINTGINILFSNIKKNFINNINYVLVKDLKLNDHIIIYDTDFNIYIAGHINKIRYHKNDKLMYFTIYSDDVNLGYVLNKKYPTIFNSNSYIRHIPYIVNINTIVRKI